MEYEHPQQPGVLVDYHAAIVCFPEVPPVIRVSAGTYVYRALLLVSALFLLATLAVYCSVPELRNLHGRCLLSHVAALLTAYSCNLAAQLPAVYSSMAACQVTGQSPKGGQSGGGLRRVIGHSAEGRREVRSQEVSVRSGHRGRSEGQIKSGHRSLTEGRSAGRSESGGPRRINSGMSGLAPVYLAGKARTSHFL